MNAVDKLYTSRQELSTCNQGRNSFLDLVYQHCDREGSQSIMDLHSILQLGAFGFAFPSAWNIFPTTFPMLDTCSSF